MFAIAPLVATGATYAFFDRGALNVKFQFLSTFILIPLIWYALSIVSRLDTARRQLDHLLLIYVATELFIMLLQASYFIAGIGLAPGDTYEFMIPGSQFNLNNLAAIVVTLSIFYNATQANRPKWHRTSFNSIVLLILLVTFSRLAILLYVADRLRKVNARDSKALLIVSTVLAGAALAFSAIDYTGNETIDASLYKAKSLAEIAEVGLTADSSTSSRSESYLHFANKLDDLGFGSGEILNYSRFTRDALFSDEAIYFNPHSLVIEFGYWAGWPGLLSLVIFLVMLYGRSKQGSWATRIFILAAVLVISSIPSSAIPLVPLWLGLILLAMLGEFHTSPAQKTSWAPISKVAHDH
ncbi:MAG: hypothetical protein O9341_18395 [Paucibacter sp.]|nr:hypothetical protein [Roseateles sp.]